MKFFLSLLLMLSGFFAVANDDADCHGNITLNTKDMWPTIINEKYELKADYFLSLSGITLSTTTAGKPAEQREYDFCEILVLGSKKVEMVCEPSEGESTRFPKALRILESNSPSQPGSFKVFALAQELPEVRFEGDIVCPEP